MCGIAGIRLPEGQRVGEELLQAMGEELRSRGPDAGGGWRKENCGLVHRRLKIIDLSDAANQPMLSDDKLVTLVFNGEIYNFQELRRALEKIGHRFRTKSDTEVVLRAYEEWGLDCLGKFNGMFAIGIFDHRPGKEALHLARDRFGIKPLFYHHNGGTFAFASTLSPLLRLPFVQKRINRDVALSFLKFSHVPCPFSAVESVNQLQPGQVLTLKGNEAKIRAFSFPPSALAPKITDENEAVQLIWDKLCDSVRRQSVADVNVGCFLSGGIDSSLILAAHAANGGGTIDTFSIGYKEKTYDERSEARLVADAFSTRHHEILMEPSEFLELAQSTAVCTDQPFADPTLLPAFVLAKLTKRNATVCFSGDGGDELFFGYLYQQMLLQIHHLSALPSSLRITAFAALERVLTPLNNALHSSKFAQLLKLTQILQYGNEAQKYQYFIGSVGPVSFDRLQRLVPGARFASQENFAAMLGELSTLSEPERITEIFQRTFMVDTVLTKTDRASMAHGLESRVPFLDNELAEAAASLDFSMKSGRHGSKRVLREILRQRLPKPLSSRIAGRKKQGFSIPLKDWLRRDLKNFLTDTLDEEKLKTEGIFAPEEVNLLVREHLSGRQNHSHLLWSLVCFEQWKAHHQL
ncbi:MAG TPA: asparagine synthase (glutamine-hydrolyzing) [Bdellovibrionota bacterium]|jgi:asparagine synthase (glutamine-hydrolysing)